LAEFGHRRRTEHRVAALRILEADAVKPGGRITGQQLEWQAVLALVFLRYAKGRGAVRRKG
jgi:hypothetical protein